jgi:WD40 repeat protein
MSLSLGLRPRLFAAAVVLLLVFAGVLLVGLLGGVSQAGALGSCPNEALRTGPSAALPDCRAYEMVSPPNKNGGEVDGGVRKGAMASPEQAAVNGEAVTYGSTSAFTEADPESAVVTSQYLSTRTAGGWQTREIVPPQQLPEGKITLLGEGVLDFSLFQGFNEDLGDGFLLAWTPQPDPSAPADYFNPYLRDSGSGAFQVLSEATPPVQAPGFADLESAGFGVVYGGMSADGQHVIFEANDALTPEAIPGRVNLYEWSAGRPLELVSVLPEGTIDTSGNKYTIGDGTTMSFGAPIQNYEMPNLSGALSSEGRRAFWSGGTATADQVYMHEVTGSGARTVEVSASQNGAVASGSAPAHYWTANADGSLVYFTSAARLTERSTETAGGQDLYQYDANTGGLSDLSADPNAGETASVLGVLGSGESEGVPYVYFVARGVLGQGASPGANNLYVWRGGASAPTFIATLGGFEGEDIDFAEAVVRRTSRVSPDGRLLAFQSSRPLTGYDNIPANGQSCPNPVRAGDGNPYGDPPEGRCMEVFEYDAQTGTLVCASCDPSGLPPVGDSMVPETPHLYENLRGWQSATVQQRYLLDDGRLFFQSEDALLPQATDGKQNVYEYEPEGVGQCAASEAGACLYLISTGEGSGDSYFADASADGRDVFFLTNQQLVSQDGDGAVDMYDAREDGGFSAAQPPPCAGEACKPAVAPAPAIYGAPSSATFQGAGSTSIAPAASPQTVKKATKKKKPTKKRAKLKQKAASKQTAASKQKAASKQTAASKQKAKRTAGKKTKMLKGEAGKSSRSEGGRR